MPTPTAPTPGWKMTLRLAAIIAGVVGSLFIAGIAITIALLVSDVDETKEFAYVIPADEATWHTFTADKLGVTLQYPTSEEYPDAYVPYDAPYDDITLTEDGAIDAFDPEAPGRNKQGDRIWKSENVRFGAFDLRWDVDIADTQDATPCTVGGRAAMCYDAVRDSNALLGYSRTAYVGYLFDYKGQHLALRFFGDKEMNATEQAIIDSLTFTE